MTLRRLSALLALLLPPGLARAQTIVPPWAAAGPVRHAVGSAEVVRVSARADNEAAVNRNPPGTVYLLQSGVHHVQQITRKTSDTIMGEFGATLKGSRHSRPFLLVGYFFVASGQWPHLATHQHGVCRAGFPRCDYPEDVYINGRPLRTVSSWAEMGPRTWHFDYTAGRVSIAHDPDRGIVELSHLPAAVGGTVARVTMRNLVANNYASPNQECAFNHWRSGSDWLVANNEVCWNQGYGIALVSGI